MLEKINNTMVSLTPKPPGRKVITEISAEMAKAKRYLEAHGISVNAVCKGGRPSQVILGTAKELRPSMVVMGAFGKGTIAKLLFGSTANEIIEDASLPLFVYH